MLRVTSSALAALLILTGGALADPIVCKVKKVADGKIVVTVDDKDTTYDVSKDAKVVHTFIVKKVAQTEDVSDGLAGVKEGADAKITVEKKDGKDTVTKIEVTDGKKKKKKKSS